VANFTEMYSSYDTKCHVKIKPFRENVSSPFSWQGYGFLPFLVKKIDFCLNGLKQKKKLEKKSFLEWQLDDKIVQRKKLFTFG
jgi:hypothetical protein